MGKALDTSGVWACGHWASHKYLCHLSGAQGFYAHRAPWTVPEELGGSAHRSRPGAPTPCPGTQMADSANVPCGLDSPTPLLISKEGVSF